MHKDQVRKFYEVLWDKHDTGAVFSVLHEDFIFRGSLGQVKHGHDGFIEYVDMVHNALGEYKCIIEELVSEDDKVFAKMTFTGMHRGEFMGYAPTERRVSWTGCALFTFKGELIADLWVLGDLVSLHEQLEGKQRGTVR